MDDRMSAIERLEQLLDEKDEEISGLREENRNLKHQHDGEHGRLLDHDEIADDGELPIPRLEVVYLKSDELGWRDCHVVYRMVYTHLTGKTISVPLGVTRIRGGAGSEPELGELPFRDGCHAHHDAELFGWPLFRVLPGQAPERLSADDYEPQRVAGRKHRRG